MYNEHRKIPVTRLAAIYNSEKLRLLILLLLVTYAYYPFMSSNDMSGPDAHWYHNILHDALIQLDHHIFPPYLGQSIFSFFGGPIIRAPYYLLLGQALHILSAGFFSALFIQHFTVFCSAFFAAFLSYFLFRRLAPTLPWWALLFAFLYISCPGVIGLIYNLDMYNSFMTIPFIPLAIYGLLRTQQNEDTLSYVLTASALSALWMAHPPIALWTSALCIAFYLLRLVFLRKGCVGFLVVIAVFTVLSLWQFVGIYSLQLGSEYIGNIQNYTAQVVNTLRADIPGVFLPLPQDSGTAFLQLGYALWFILLLGLIKSWQPENRFLIQSLLLSIVGLFIFLYPLPLLGPLVWSLLPQTVDNITAVWPQQRFYPILATLICYLGILRLKKLYPANNFFVKYALATIFIVLFSWSAYEASFFVRTGLARTATVNLWNNPENIYFYPNHVLPLHTQLSFGAYDPRLKNKLLDKKLLPLRAYDNEAVAEAGCFQKNSPALAKFTIVGTRPQLPAAIIGKDHTTSPLKPFLSFQLLSEKPQLLCLDTTLSATGYLTIEIINGAYVSDLFIPASKIRPRMLTLPLYKNHEENRIQTLYFSRNGQGKMVINNYRIAVYDPESLPIQIVEFTPYRATVTTPQDHDYLQIFKEYYPGYMATVNGKNTEVLATADKLVLIPLQHKGFNQIELIYVGTTGMRYAFYISSIAWGVFILYLVFQSKLMRRSSTTKGPRRTCE